MILNDKVYLGDTLLDLGEANGVTFEYSISDPADMAAIFTPGSWTVNLPNAGSSNVSPTMSARAAATASRAAIRHNLDDGSRIGSSRVVVIFRGFP